MGWEEAEDLTLTGEILLNGLEKFAGLLNQSFNTLRGKVCLYSIIGAYPLVESLQKPALILRVENARLGEMLSKGCMNTAMFLKSQPLLAQQSFSHIKHRVVGSAGRSIPISVLEGSFRRMDCSGRLLEQFLRGLFHERVTLLRIPRARWKEKRCRREAMRIPTHTPC